MLQQLKLKWRKPMATSRMKDTMTVWQRADIAAQLSAIAYMDPKPAGEACKKLGFTNAN